MKRLLSSKARSVWVLLAFLVVLLPPCDSFQGNNIIESVQEEMLFTYIAGKTAYGTITTSSAGNTGLAVS